MDALGTVRCFMYVQGIIITNTCTHIYTQTLKHTTHTVAFNHRLIFIISRSLLSFNLNFRKS